MEESTGGGVRTDTECVGTGSELVLSVAGVRTDTCVGAGSELVFSFCCCAQLCVLILTE